MQLLNYSNKQTLQTAYYDL